MCVTASSTPAGVQQHGAGLFAGSFPISHPPAGRVVLVAGKLVKHWPDAVQVQGA